MLSWPRMAERISTLPAPVELQAYREQAAAAARLGGAELRRFFGAGVEARLKTSSRDLVTEADLTSERCILDFIERRYPDHGWQSEEAGTRPGRSPLRWVIDPLDGTANFAHGYPHFAVSVALLYGERSVAGAVYDPLRDECFDAALGEGAALNGKVLHVSPVTTLDRALVSTGFPYTPDRRSVIADLTARAIERVQMLRRSGSAALDCAYVAAGLLLVREAGGRADEIRFVDWPRGYLVSNGTPLHDQVLDLIRTFLGPIDVQPATLVTGGHA